MSDAVRGRSNAPPFLLSALVGTHCADHEKSKCLYDPGTDEIHLHKKEKTGNEDLLEFAAIQTLLNGGTVYMIGAEKMPNPDP